MFVIRKRLFPNEGSDPNTRYDETEDCVQRTFDGGETWNCDDNADPRTSPTFLNPAAADDKCAGAQGVSNFVRDFLEGAYQAFNVVGIASWAIQIGFFFTPLTIFWRIAMLVGEGLIEIGELTLQATFDEDTFDQIRDIAYCWLDETGKFPDQAAFDGFGAQLQEDIGGSTFNIVMALMFNLYGWVGFSNAAIKYAENADCSGATCAWCYEVPLSELPKDGITYTLNFGFGQQSACGLETTAAGAAQIINAQIFFPAAVITDLEFEYTTGAVKGAAARQWDFKNNGTPLRSGVLDAGIGTYMLGQYAINVEVDEFYFSLDTTTSGGLTNCGTLLRLRGDGVNPFPESNCT